MAIKFEDGTEFWVISDIHGHYHKLLGILAKLGILDGEADYGIDPDTTKRVIFLGDYIDKGPHPLEVIDLVITLVDMGIAKAIMGNHDFWLQRYLNGADVMLKAERKDTLSRLSNSDPNWRPRVKEFLDNLPFFYEFGDFKFAHAIYSQSAAQKPKKNQRHMLYGPTDKDAPPRADGLPNRVAWYETYGGHKGTIIFGHYSLNNEISEYAHAVCVDCGVFNEDGKLGAYEILTKRKVHV